MQCLNKIPYMVQAGDSLYKIARRFHTTVEDIMSLNPHASIYNLQIGEVLQICPATRSPVYQPREISLAQSQLSDEMRGVWEQHVMWTRLLIISILDSLDDTDTTSKRLLENPRNIADIFRRYYGNAVADQIENLLKEHLIIGAEIIKAVKNNDSAKEADLEKLWYENADEMARAFASINPNYDFEKLQQMLHQHLNLTKQEVAMRHARNYPLDASTFDTLEQEALGMANDFTMGIVQQFPNYFR